eukprot:gnl/TRDRNA2_/TRDRNA2_191223_c0_seq1.p1 gnl/TRDRNA2_/TRDRNA2_191223_c0~~gnl/TRDRNA2_/TRDRNA2_191223_c0_seq1.p1  ORF type:complete len:112 (+),score=13.26 gnl/TRDRNA2_/TRDRNA2_191223_c0_seq1:201-536(+)
MFASSFWPSSLSFFLFDFIADRHLHEELLDVHVDQFKAPRSSKRNFYNLVELVALDRSFLHEPDAEATCRLPGARSMSSALFLPAKFDAAEAPRHGAGTASWAGWSIAATS